MYVPVAMAQGVSSVGVPLDSALRALAAQGINLVFSSDLVDPNWRVGQPPTATTPLQRARELVRPFGLTLKQLGPTTYVVVRAQADQVLRGRVIDQQRGLPLPFARLTLTPGFAAARSDRNGAFLFKRLRPGDYSLRVTLSDYRDVVLETVAVPQAGEPLQITLVPAKASIDEIVVAASRYRVSGGDLMRADSLDQSQLDAQPGLREDALRATSRIPGFSQGDLSSAAYVRGGDTDETLVLIDGFALRQPYHLPGYQNVFSVIDPAVTSKMDVYTGGFPARYGQRMSAVVDISTVSSAASAERELGLSFLNASALANGPIPGTERWDALAIVRSGTLHYLFNAFAPNSTSPTYADAFARLHVAADASNDVSLYVLAARDELHVVDSDLGQRGSIASDSAYVWLQGTHRWSERVEAKAWLGRTQLNADRLGTLNNTGIGQGTVADERRSASWDARIQARWIVNTRQELQGGIEATYATADYNYNNRVAFEPAVAALFGAPALSTASIAVAPQRRELAGYVSHRWRVTTAVSTEIGLRLQRESGLGLEPIALADPRAALRWSLAPETQLRVAWGRFHQADEVFQLRVEDGMTAFESPQRSEHLIVGVDHRLGNGVALRLEAYRKTQSEPRQRFENLINPLTYFPELAPDRVRIGPDHGELRGVELSAEHRGEPWSWWASYTYADAIDEMGGIEVPRSWDQLHAVKVGVQWLRGRWEWGGSAQLHSGWHTTPLYSTGGGTTVLGARNSQQLPTFASLDLRLAYTRKLPGGELKLTAELTNATNHSNACCRELAVTGSPGGPPQFVTETTSTLPILPFLSVHWRF